MKAFILLLLLVQVGFSDSAVNQSQEPKSQGTPLAFNQLGPKRSGPRTSYSVVCGILDRRRMVIRDRETLATAGVTLAASVINLVTAIIKARSEGVKRATVPTSRLN